MVSVCPVEILDWRQSTILFMVFLGPLFVISYLCCCQAVSESCCYVTCCLFFLWNDVGNCSSLKPVGFVSGTWCSHALFLGWIVSCMAEVPNGTSRMASVCMVLMPLFYRIFYRIWHYYRIIWYYRLIITE